VHLRSHQPARLRLEGFFILGGEFLSNVVRKGVCAEAIAKVVQGPPVEILQDFNKCLREFASSAQGRVSVSHDDVKAVHAQLMRSSRIGYAEFVSVLILSIVSV
ncbi:hypothetical protein L227DRAFT_577425, partial [Lentinus tigrinus ALCF2SS1-6]